MLNEAYEALGRHFMCAIMPAQPRKPKQKASVEGTVGKIVTAVIARLRDREFATLAELNEAVLECVGAFNSAPFQKRDGSRASVFGLVESEFLSPLLAGPLEVCEWVYGRAVNLDFHAVFEKNRYSVPCRHVGSRADLRVTAGTVDVYIGGERVASRPRLPSYAQYRYQTDPSHSGEPARMGPGGRLPVRGPVLERLPFPSARIPRVSASVPGASFLSLCDEGSA